FWLTLASLVVPAQMRLGYDGDAASGREVPLAEQVHDAAYAAWGFAVQVGQACDTNPSLCAAGQNLITTVSDTGASLVKEAQARFAEPKPEPKTAHLADASTHA